MRPPAGPTRGSSTSGRSRGGVLLPVFDSGHLLLSQDVERDPVARRAAARLSLQRGRVARGGNQYAEVAVADRAGNVLLFSAPLRATLQDVGLVQSRLLWSGLAALGVALHCGLRRRIRVRAADSAAGTRRRADRRRRFRRAGRRSRPGRARGAGAGLRPDAAAARPGRRRPPRVHRQCLARAADADFLARRLPRAVSRRGARRGHAPGVSRDDDRAGGAAVEARDRPARPLPARRRPGAPRAGARRARGGRRGPLRGVRRRRAAAGPRARGGRPRGGRRARRPRAGAADRAGARRQRAPAHAGRARPFGSWPGEPISASRTTGRAFRPTSRSGSLPVSAAWTARAPREPGSGSRSRGSSRCGWAAPSSSSPGPAGRCSPCAWRRFHGKTSRWLQSASARRRSRAGLRRPRRRRGDRHRPRDRPRRRRHDEDRDRAGSRPRRRTPRPSVRTVAPTLAPRLLAGRDLRPAVARGRDRLLLLRRHGRPGLGLRRLPQRRDPHERPRDHERGRDERRRPSRRRASTSSSPTTTACPRGSSAGMSSTTSACSASRPRRTRSCRIPLGRSASVVVGEPVAAIGSPLGNLDSLAVGIVSAVHRSIAALTNPRFQLIDAIQTDAPIAHGSSGGPLLDARGRAIGITAQIRTDQGGAVGHRLRRPDRLRPPLPRTLC